MKYSYKEILESYKDRKLNITEEEYRVICDVLHCNVQANPFYNYIYKNYENSYTINNNSINYNNYSGLFNSTVYNGTGSTGYYYTYNKDCSTATMNYWSTDTNTDMDYTSYNKIPISKAELSVTYTYTVFWEGKELGEICYLTLRGVLKDIKKINNKLKKEKIKKLLS